MQEKGSKYLDELIVAVDIAFPQTLTKTVLNNTTWKSLLEVLATVTSLAVDKKVRLLKLNIVMKLITCLHIFISLCSDHEKILSVGHLFKTIFAASGRLLSVENQYIKML